MIWQPHTRQRYLVNVTRDIGYQIYHSINQGSYHGLHVSNLPQPDTPSEFTFAPKH